MELSSPAAYGPAATGQTSHAAAVRFRHAVRRCARPGGDRDGRRHHAFAPIAATTRCCASGPMPSRAARRSTLRSASARAHSATRTIRPTSSGRWATAAPTSHAGDEGDGRRRAGLPRDQEQPGLSDAVLHAVDLSRDAARRRHLPRHRRHHAEGPRRPSAQRHAATRCAPPPPRRRSTAAASSCSRTCAASTPRAWCGWPTARSGSARKTRPRSRIFRPTAGMIERHVPAGTEADFAGAPYETIGSLPAILAKRQANRGIEGDRGLARRALSLFHHAEPAGQSGHRRLPAGAQHAAVQARPRDHEGRRRIRLHARRSAELPPRSLDASRTIRASAN